MNQLTNNLMKTFSRTPMIKFLGPRANLPLQPKNPQQLSSSSSAPNLPPLSNGPSVTPPSVQYPSL